MEPAASRDEVGPKGGAGPDPSPGLFGMPADGHVDAAPCRQGDIRASVDRRTDRTRRTARTTGRGRTAVTSAATGTRPRRTWPALARGGRRRRLPSAPAATAGCRGRRSAAGRSPSRRTTCGRSPWSPSRCSSWSAAASRPRRGALLGLVFGLAIFLPLLAWMRVIGADAWVPLSLLEAAFLAADGALLPRVLRLPGWPLWVGLPVGGAGGGPRDRCRSAASPGVGWRSPRPLRPSRRTPHSAARRWSRFAAALSRRPARRSRRCWRAAAPRRRAGRRPLARRPARWSRLAVPFVGLLADRRGRRPAR